uniref:Low specificity L-threonine aldolase n=1 Tax=Schlesneria paludicola TaxID=360056 RepID=A0A7C2K224_9PLAN
MKYGVIDLRSDTVTRPTPGMRRAIAEADVGDDMSAEDPTVNRLEARMAELLGHEAAVYACSGTQSNQMGVRAHCQSGDELLIEEWSHIANWEAGGAAALTGVTCRTIRGRGGMLDVADLAGKIRPDNQHYCITRLVCLENTTNHGGGQAYPLDQMARVSAWAKDNGLKRHLDGARLFNACLVGGYSPRDCGQLFDTISICFSKGLGCPMGSILVGDAESIRKARRARKLFGGALRQAGMMAAAALYALDHHVDRMVEDHDNAKVFAEAIAEIDGVILDPDTVTSNLIFFELDPSCGPAVNLAAKLKAQKVLLNATGPQRLRAVTHLDVTRDDVLQAAAAIRNVLEGAPVSVGSTAGLTY